MTNQGSLALQTLISQQADANLTQTVTLTFTGAGSFDVVGTGTGNPSGVAYVPGQRMAPVTTTGFAASTRRSSRKADSSIVSVP